MRRTAPGTNRWRIVRRMAGRTLASALAWGAMLPVTAASAQEPELVSLRYEWPDSMRIRVHGSMTRERSGPAGGDSTGVQEGEAGFTLVALPHPRGQLVDFRDFWIEGHATDLAAGPFPKAREAWLTSVFDGLDQLVDGLLVAQSGEPITLLGADEAAAVVRDAITRSMEASALKPDSAERRLGQEILARFMNGDVLAESAMNFWVELVGFWIDADLEVGAFYETEFEIPLPAIFGEAEVTNLVEFGITRRTACTDGAGTLDCVELWARSRPDPEELAAVVQGFMQGMIAEVEEALGSDGASTQPGVPPTDPGFEFLEIYVENESWLITEPDGLIPHKLTQLEQIRPALEADGQWSEPTQTEVRTFEFSYGDGAFPVEIAPGGDRSVTAALATSFVAQSADGFAMGPDDAEFTIEVYSDYLCDHCQNFEAQIGRPLRRRYAKTGGPLRWIHHEFVLSDRSYPGTMAALCAGQQSRYWSMHDELFDRTAEWGGATDPEAVFLAMADELRLDRDRFLLCLGNPFNGFHPTRLKAAGVARGVQGTPTLFVNGIAVPRTTRYYSFEGLNAMILQDTTLEQNHAGPAWTDDLDQPRYIPRATEPVLQNSEQVRGLLADEFPAELRAQGVSGSVTLWLFVDENGRVTRSRVKDASEHREFDETASRIAVQLRFEPARTRDGEPVGVWIANQFDFKVVD